MSTETQGRPAEQHAGSRLLPRKKAAEYLGIQPQTLAVWATTGRYQLPQIKIGSKSMYAIEDLEEFKRKRTVVSGERNEASK